jgi:hypothetical protein
MLKGSLKKMGKLEGRGEERSVNAQRSVGAAVVEHDDIAFDGAGAERHDLAIDPDLGAYRLAGVNRRRKARHRATAGRLGRHRRRFG